MRLYSTEDLNAIRDALVDSHRSYTLLATFPTAHEATYPHLEFDMGGFFSISKQRYVALLKIIWASSLKNLALVDFLNFIA
jgi:hypothetical protein